MADADRSQTIRKAYNERYGSKKETYDKLNERKGPKDEGRTSMKEVRKRYLENDIGALKKQPGSNSYVPPSKDHEIQMDLFEFKYKQPIRQPLHKTEIGGQVYDLGRATARTLNPVEPYGITGINTFTKKVHVSPVSGKIGRDDWKPAMKKPSMN